MFCILGHMRHEQAIDGEHPFFRRADVIAVEIGSPLLELRKVLHGSQTAFGTVNLLVEYPA